MASYEPRVKEINTIPDKARTSTLILFSFLGILFGLLFSYIFNIPSGPAIIVALIVIMLIVKMGAFVKGKIG